MNIEQRDGLIVGRFTCMASPCEILLDTDDWSHAESMADSGMREAFRIEHKFSRYRDDNIVYRINNSQGQPVAIDPEIHQLLQFADQCYGLSEGLFDITSGVLRRAWRFDGKNRLPDQQDIDKLLGLIGWNRVEFDAQSIRLPEGMEIDFGGIGKEYAVDRVAHLISDRSSSAVMVNFGGDCHASKAPRHAAGWYTGIEDPLKPGDASAVIRLRQGALATSGDAFRHILHKGKRYGHVINPLTGWPALDAPRQVTVAAPSCIEAGILSTLALLQGGEAEAFLQQQDARYWCLH